MHHTHPRRFSRFRRLFEIGLRLVQLWLPALVPSWRFFDFIAPSPRMQMRTIKSNTQDLTDWQPVLPVPAQVSVTQMLARLFWNPLRNEQLFLMTCAERLLEQHQPDLELDMARRIARHHPPAPQHHLQFRILLVTGSAPQQNTELAFVSRLIECSELHP